MIVQITILAVLFIIGWFIVSRNGKKNAGSEKPVPRIGGLFPWIWPAVRFGVDPISTLSRACEQMGPVFRIHLVVFEATFVQDVAAWPAYFNAREDTLSFDRGVIKFIQPIFGIPTELEKKQADTCHRVLRHGLGRALLDMYAHRAYSRAVGAWGGRQRAYPSLHRACNDLVAAINVSNFMAVPGADPSEIARLLAQLEENGTSPLALMLPQLPTPALLRTRQARERLGDIIRNELSRRRAEVASGDRDVTTGFQDFLDQFLCNENAVSDDLMRNTMIALFFGAHHNTTNTLTWLLYHLHRPEQGQTLETVKNELGKLGQSPSAEQLADPSATPLLDACIKEISRLYFSVMLPPRRVEKPFTAGGVVVPVGSYLCVSPIHIHRDPRFFEHPNAFEPRRFLPGGSAASVGMEFCQFGYGRHRCTGERYALTVLKSILSALLADPLAAVSLSLDDSTPALPEFSKPIGTAAPSKPIPFSITCLPLSPNVLMTE